MTRTEAVIEELDGRTVVRIEEAPDVVYLLRQGKTLLASATLVPASKTWTQALYAPRTGRAQPAGTAEYEVSARAWICNRLRPGLYQ